MRRQPLQHAQPEGSAADAAAGEAQGRPSALVQTSDHHLPEREFRSLVLRHGRAIRGISRLMPQFSFPLVDSESVVVFRIARTVGIARRVRAAPVFFPQSFPNRQRLRLAALAPAHPPVQGPQTPAHPHRRTPP